MGKKKNEKSEIEFSNPAEKMALDLLSEDCRDFVYDWGEAGYGDMYDED